MTCILKNGKCINIFLEMRFSAIVGRLTNNHRADSLLLVWRPTAAGIIKSRFAFPRHPISRCTSATACA
jgi:hypothetical protein